MDFHDFYVKSVSCPREDTRSLEDRNRRGLAVIEREVVGDEFFDGFKEGVLSFGYSTDSGNRLLAIYMNDKLICDF